MKYDAERRGLKTVGERVQATTACGWPEAGKLMLGQRVFGRSPVGLGCDAEQDDSFRGDFG